MVLCMNTRYEGNEEVVRFEQMMLDVKAGVAYLRKQPGITKVLLFAHSGGGPTMSFYEAVAENGVAFCQRPEKLVRCGDDLAGLPPADGIVYADAHPGNPVNVVRGINPSVVNENDPPDKRVDRTLDPFSPANGFNPNGPSHYSALDGIDDCSSNNSTICAVGSISVPELFTAMGGHYFVRDVEREYDLAKDQGQGLRRDRGRDAFLHALRRVREDARRVRELDEEHVRLHRSLDRCPVLAKSRRVPDSLPSGTMKSLNGQGPKRYPTHISLARF